jgi:endonuclease/exonuclease/phosphatase family metal-dependent hydrolase
LTQNTFLRPTSFLLGLDRENEKRSYTIKKMIKNYDIIGLQEVFDNDLQKILTGTNIRESGDCDDLEKKKLTKKDAGIKVKDFPVNKEDRKLVRGKYGNFYFVLGPDESNFAEDGGLVILSKLPIILASALVYKEESGADALANKGALYARVDMEVPPKKRCYIHVFNTHTQAQNDKNAKNVRIKQFEELAKFIKMCTGNDGYPIILMGDLNVVALKPQNWGKTQGVYEKGKKPPTNKVSSQEYIKMISIFSNPKLTDVWLKLHPKHPGLTWIGNPETGWRTIKNSPWGSLGNVLADSDDKDPPGRLDYFLYHPGGTQIPCIERRKYLLSLTSINLVPSSSLNKKPYKFGKIVSHTVSDHLGVEMKCNVGCR